jgi:hypothetical protein
MKSKEGVQQYDTAEEWLRQAKQSSLGTQVLGMMAPGLAVGIRVICVANIGANTS